MRPFLFAMMFLGLTHSAGAQQPPPPDRGPPRFELGKVLPPFARQAVTLTDEQKKQIAELEKEVKAKLEKILTAEQIKALESTRPTQGRGERPANPTPPAQTPTVKPKETTVGTGGIQWFATWDSAKAEAARTNKPILMVSAAPHCSGISGIW